jgi:hypothetical protein
MCTGSRLTGPAKAIVGYSPAVAASRVTKLVNRKPSTHPAALADHLETPQSTRVRITGQNLLFGSFCRNRLCQLLLLVQLPKVCSWDLARHYSCLTIVEHIIERDRVCPSEQSAGFDLRPHQIKQELWGRRRVFRVCPHHCICTKIIGFNHSAIGSRIECSSFTVTRRASSRTETLLGTRRLVTCVNHCSMNIRT